MEPEEAWDCFYNDLNEEEEYDESAMYFDVPLPYLPLQLTKDKPLWRTSEL